MSAERDRKVFHLGNYLRCDELRRRCRTTWCYVGAWVARAAIRDRDGRTRDADANNSTRLRHRAHENGDANTGQRRSAPFLLLTRRSRICVVASSTCISRMRLPNSAVALAGFPTCPCPSPAFPMTNLSNRSIDGLMYIRLAVSCVPACVPTSSALTPWLTTQSSPRS